MKSLAALLFAPALAFALRTQPFACRLSLSLDGLDRADPSVLCPEGHVVVKRRDQPCLDFTEVRASLATKPEVGRVASMLAAGNPHLPALDPDLLDKFKAHHGLGRRDDGGADCRNADQNQ